MKRKHKKGYALPTVLAMTALLASGAAMLFATMRTSIDATSASVKRRKSFYVCDGLGRTITRLANNYLVTTTSPDANEMKTSVCNQAGGCTTGNLMPTLKPLGYSIEEFEITPVGTSETNTPLPNGPFRGMNAKIDSIEFLVRARSPEGYECRTEQEVSLGQISIFQFYVFSDTHFDSHPGPQMTLNGRVHVNGSACLGGNMNMSRITSSGQVLGLSGEGCKDYGGWMGNVSILDGSGVYRTLLDSQDANSNSDWSAYAITRWGGNVLDASHDVPELKPPTLNPPVAQAGRFADGSLYDNTGSLRFVVDPLLDGEPDDAKEQKYAYKADLRILDGVWYLRDETSPEDIGTPIWSDHPGAFSENHPEGLVAPQVGQVSVGTAQGWSNVPQGFSYYRYSTTGQLLPRTTTTNRGTISYGTLGYRNFSQRGTQATRWEPATWFDNGVGSKWGACGGSGNAIAGDATSSLEVQWFYSREQNLSTGTNRYSNLNSTIGQSSSTGASNCDQLLLLNASRMGFTETHRQGGGSFLSWSTPNRGQMLPLNFDVEAFTAAMQNTADGELGDIFAGREFNGVVWVGATWPGSLNGITTGTAPNLASFDAQGTSATTLAANGQAIGPTWVRTRYPRTSSGFTAPGSNYGPASNIELPRALCSSDPGVVGATMANYGGGAASAFTVPPCAEYTGARGSQVNALRVFNAQQINPTVFPEGLSIVTNVPVYALGDLNISSTPNGSPWVPFMIGGDAMFHLSNVWQDSNAGWQYFEDSYHGTSTWRTANTTTYNYSAMAGWIPSHNGARGTVFHNFNGYNERWAVDANWGVSIPQFINASNVIGWASVYMDNGRSSGPPQYTPPQRQWQFDTNYEVFMNQPPGAPVFDVAAIKRFERN